MTWKLPKELEPFREYIYTGIFDSVESAHRVNLGNNKFNFIDFQIQLLQRLIKAGLLNQWISVNDSLPEKTKKNQVKSYLVIRETESPVNYCKDWAGKGKPEIAAYCSDWPYPWSLRGTLTVAYWAELPKFNMKWEKGNEGEAGQWMPLPNPPKDYD
jgi:hypothetical protein